MSGIFGFTYPGADEQTLSDALGGLEYWTRKYGYQGKEHRAIGDSGIGCHIQHYTQRFPYGGPILELNGDPAVVDALLYNRDELAALLHMERDRIISDEELLLELIAQKGYEALEYVNGDFAGAVFHAATGEWTLFRDHLGVRPLYVYLDDEKFAFSTDMRGLAALPNADLAINEKLLYYRFLDAKNLTLTETDFLRINCVRPASVTRFKRTSTGFSCTESLYWSLKRRKIRFRRDEDYRKELRRLVEDAIHRRCDAIDGLIGGELSGGLDSSIIGILINRYGRDSLFFSWSRSPEEIPLLEGRDERKVVLAICEQENVTCQFNSRENRIAYHDKLEYVHLPYVSTYPMGIGSNFLRSRGARVVFTGHTGDEGVSHRARRFELIWNREFWAYFKLYHHDLKGQPFALLRGIRAGLKDGIDYYRKTKSSPDDDWFFPDYLDRSFSERLRSSYTDPKFSFQFDPAAYVNQGGSRHRFDIAAYHGSFNDTQYLFPYADYRVLDYALSIPRRLYLNPTQSRVIFRDTFDDLMPRELAEVDYKQTPTLEHRKRSDDYEESFNANLNRILSDLNRERWSGILNFDKISATRPSDDRTESAYITLHLSYLVRCIRIQRMQDDCKDWRKMDERDNKTV